MAAERRRPPPAAEEFGRRWGLIPCAAAGTASAARGRVAVAHWRVEAEAPREFVCAAVPAHVVAVHPTPVERHTLLIDGREVRPRAPIPPGAVQIVRAGELAEGRAAAGRYDFLHLYVPPGLLARAADEAGLPRAPELVDPRYEGGPDPLLEYLARRLIEVAGDGGGALDRLLADDLTRCLATHLLRRYASGGSTSGPRPSAGRGALPGWRLRRVVRFVEDRLPGEVGLDELAGLAGLSAFHFRETFRRATGASPSRFVLNRRVERAKAMLADPGPPIAAVALACGFADQQHLTKRFRQVTGLTPKAYRDRFR